MRQRIMNGLISIPVKYLALSTADLVLVTRLTSEGLEHPILRNMAREFQQRQAESNPVQLLLLLATVVLVLWLVWLLGQVLAPNEKRNYSPRPKRLFYELCRAHRLTRWQSALLWNFTRILSLSDPVKIFTEPGYLQNSELTLNLREAEQLRKIEKIIFAGLKGQPSTPCQNQPVLCQGTNGRDSGASELCFDQEPPKTEEVG
jgi:hypothetical protein